MAIPEPIQTELELLLIPIKTCLKECGFVQRADNDQLWDSSASEGPVFGYKIFVGSSSIFFQIIPYGSYFGGSTDPSIRFSVYVEEGENHYTHSAPRDGDEHPLKDRDVFMQTLIFQLKSSNSIKTPA